MIDFDDMEKISDQSRPDPMGGTPRQRLNGRKNAKRVSAQNARAIRQAEYYAMRPITLPRVRFLEGADE